MARGKKQFPWTHDMWTCHWKTYGIRIGICIAIETSLLFQVLTKNGAVKENILKAIDLKRLITKVAEKINKIRILRAPRIAFEGPSMSMESKTTSANCSEHAKGTLVIFETCWKFQQHYFSTKAKLTVTVTLKTCQRKRASNRALPTTWEKNTDLSARWAVFVLTDKNLMRLSSDIFTIMSEKFQNLVVLHANLRYLTQPPKPSTSKDWKLEDTTAEYNHASEPTSWQATLKKLEEKILRWSSGFPRRSVNK